jgi:two-component system NtrC family sensor kinase
MTIRAKVVLFAVVALGMVGVLGVEIHNGGARGFMYRLHMVATHDQVSLYGQMHEDAWAYVNEMLRARREGRDTQALLSGYEQRQAATLARLQENLSAKVPWVRPETLEQRKRYAEEVHQAQQRWATLAGERLRSAPLEPADPVRAVFTDFEQQVAPVIAKAVMAEQEQLDLLSPKSDWNMLRARAVSYVIPGVSLLLIGGLALLILVPMQHQLRALLKGAERIGNGDFDVALPEGQRDELGTLAKALNRMAHELRKTLKEKQQLIEAEARVAEREARRYNERLEETVRTRTAELEQANAQLASSLEQLQVTQAQLRFADRLATVGRLAAGVAHELNNPMSFVLSNLSYMKEELNRGEGQMTPQGRTELLSALADAHEGARRVRQIAQDLKTLARPDEGERSAVNLKEVVHGAVKMASVEIRNKAQVVEDYQELPPVLGNAARLGQVFLNLLINAAQAIPSGNPDQNQIRVAARAHPDRITVEVSDTGKGIPKEALERVFEPFFTTKPEGEGTGLGLSISHGIITALGGTIDVESEVGKGTTFRITLPIAPVSRGP